MNSVKYAVPLVFRVTLPRWAIPCQWLRRPAVTDDGAARAITLAHARRDSAAGGWAAGCRDVDAGGVRGRVDLCVERWLDHRGLHLPRLDVDRGAADGRPADARTR